MSDLNAFRNETRDWLEANCPESMRTPMSQGDVAVSYTHLTLPTNDLV